MSVNGGTDTNRVRGGAVAANGYIYHLGGNDGGTTVASVEYAKLNADGSVGTWAATTSLPGARRQFQPVVVNNYIYVAGGRDASSTTQSTVYYAHINNDGTLGSWNTANPLNDGSTAPRFEASTFAYNGYIYVTGGFNASVTLQTTSMYAKVNPDGSLGSWSTTTVTPTGMSVQNAVVANGYVYMAGGFTVSDGGDSDDIFYAKLNVDGTIGSWTTVAFPLNGNGSLGSIINLANLPNTRIGEAGEATANGYLYILGGSTSGDGGGTLRNSVYYASVPRVKIGGSLDLVSYGGENLNEGGTGGTLTAGNTLIVGTLNVQDATSFSRGVNIGGDLSVNGNAIIKSSTDSTTAFQVQNAAGTSNIFVVDTVNSKIGIGTATPNSYAGKLTVYSSGYGFIGRRRRGGHDWYVLQPPIQFLHQQLNFPSKLADQR
jgi:hypothetical protein